MEETVKEVNNEVVDLDEKEAKSDKKITISFNSNLISVFCDLFVLLCCIIMNLLVTEDAFKAKDVFVWISTFPLLAGIVFYVIRCIKEKKFCISAEFILKLFTFYIYLRF